jgi:hypothetical protein
MSQVLYFLFSDGQPLTCLPEDLAEVCEKAGYTLICQEAKVDGCVRHLTEAEIALLPMDENSVFVRLAKPDQNGFVLLHYTDTPPSSIEHAKWPNSRIGNKTEKGYPFLVPLRDLFPQLQQQS